MTNAAPQSSTAIEMDPAAMMAAAARLLNEDPIFAVGEAEIRGNTYRVFKNAPPSLVGMFMVGALNGDADFLIYEDEKYSFTRLWGEACRFADALINQLGVKKGDRVGIAMRNYPEWCASYMGAIAAGAVVIPLNAWWKTDEFDYALDDCNADVIVVDAKRLELIKPLREKQGLKLILARDEGEGADYRFDELIAKSEATAPPPVDIDPEDDFCISYTSGSTGHPKGVILTHRSAITTLISWSFVGSILKELKGGVSPFGENAGILLGIPLFHVTGSHSIFMLSWLVGRRMAMMYRWDAKHAADIIRREELTNFVGVPSQSFELIEGAGEEGLPTLLDIGSGGAKRPPEHVRKLKERFNKANPSSGYGLTETNALGCIISQSDYQKRPDSTGRAVPPVTDIKIMKEDGAPAAVKEVGEVWIRSPANFRGYLNRAEDTERALTEDGWFRTGDLGFLDEEAFLYIVDRLKDMIIRGGENISCLEVENRVYEHDGIAEASVFSVPDEVLGERVGLVFFPKDGAKIDPTELREFISVELADFKVPELIWVSPQPLPRLGTEKFDKRTVRTIAMQHPASLDTTK